VKENLINEKNPTGGSLSFFNKLTIKEYSNLFIAKLRKKCNGKI